MNSGITARLKQLEREIGTATTPDLGPLVDQTARELGVTPEEVRREMEELRRSCEAVGARTVDEVIAFVAADVGATPGAVRQGAEALAS